MNEESETAAKPDPWEPSFGFADEELGFPSRVATSPDHPHE